MSEEKINMRESPEVANVSQISAGFYCKVTRRPELEPCKHPRCATARELYPEGIHNLQLHCIVCTEPVSSKRAIGHYKETCSAKCNGVFKEWKRYVVESRFCPNCLHPNTPEQRLDFHTWRKERGYSWKKANQMQIQPKREEKLEDMLRKAHSFIKGTDVANAVTSAQGEPESWLLKDIEKLIDTKKQNAVTLATSGEPASTGENNVALG